MQHSNWGKYPSIDAPEIVYRPGLPVEAMGSSWIPRGMGRCYGDSSLGKHMLSSHNLNRFLDFDADSGLLTCESGVTFADILETFVPKGWFPPVTPGTKFVSMGGAIASDVHGKNHHKEGAISRHILQFDLLLADGRVRTCSREENSELFRATLGGMGLTGMVLRLTLQLKPIETAFIDLHNIRTRNLDELMELFEEYADSTYSVAWIDALAKGKDSGKGILMLGEHATRAKIQGTSHEPSPLQIPSKRAFNIPFDFPAFALNPLSMKAFNLLFYHKQLKKEVRGLADYDSYFYPLDALHHWNRIYGKRGFTQYQFAIPREAGKEGMREILNRIARSGQGSFLTVLKAFGPEDEGMIGFPMEGYTLALDFPITRPLFAFLDELDTVVADYGGRIYLSKDARMKPEMLAQGYPRLEEFRSLLKELDAEQRIRSLQSERLLIHG